MQLIVGNTSNPTWRNDKFPMSGLRGVYGDLLSEPVKGYDEHQYHVLNGKVTNKREIGCYFSHLEALRLFLKTEIFHALILEDDVTLPENITPLLEEAMSYSKAWDILRLTSSREGEFLDIGSLQNGFKLAYNTRVFKNTGAYMINRHAAQCSLKHMRPMRLPYDVALDRDWDFGFRTACIVPFPVKLETEMPSQIPRAERLRLHRSTTFHLFHLKTHFERKRHRRQYYRQYIQTNGLINDSRLT